MICIKCGHSNPGGLNYCQKCNAYLVKLGGVPASTSSLDVEEGKSYLTPQRSYPTEYLYNLTCRAYEYVHQGASGDPLLEAYQLVRARMEEFEAEGLPMLVGEFTNERQENPEDDYAVQMIYLMNKGVSIYREGYELMDRFIESGDNDTLIEAIARLQEGNDNLGLAGELAQLRSARIDEELARIQQAKRAMQQAPGGAAAADAPPAAPPSQSAQERVDSARKI